VRVAGGCRGAQETGKAAKAAVSTTPTIDQSLEWKSVFNPRIFADGKRVVYEVQRPIGRKRIRTRSLWIVDIATGESHALTSAEEKIEHQCGLSPDGNGSRFFPTTRTNQGHARGQKKTTLLYFRDGAEAQQLTKVENDVNAFDWARIRNASLFP